MQISRGLSFLAGLALVARGAQTAPQQQQQQQQQLRASKTAAVHLSEARLADSAVAKTVAVDLAEDAPVQMRVVEVPVVVIRLDGADVDEGATGAAAPASGHGMSAACAKEMSGLERNASRFGQSQQCEEKTGRSQRAIESLQKANTLDAEELVQKTFHECAGLTSNCAKEVAPQVVLKMRLSGLAISECCASVARDGQVGKSKANVACQENATKGMVAALGHQDIDAAMSAAQAGLKTCQHVEAPCDFQLAPILVVQLLQAGMEQQEEQIQEVLMTGMRAAEEMSEKVELGEFSPVSTGKHHIIDPKANNKKAKVDGGRKATLSLLTINSNLRVSTRQQNVML